MPYCTNPKYGASRRRTRGLTLIELVVAVAIVGILTMVAVPSYRGYIVRTNRAAAGACATELAQYMERVYTTNLRYDQNNGAATTLPTTQCRTDLNATYVFSLPTASLAQRTFVVTATPQGKQSSDDAECGALSLNQAGAKSISGSGTANKCWR